ncbi:MAG: AraC family transcriptional regulator [Verrucomicrobiota bacterium]|nr:AraC family transcriptional regulator [Verrucomicrobiota bacterium]
MPKKHFKYTDFVEADQLRFRIGTGVLEYKSFDMHDHEFAELVFIRGGSAIHVTRQEEHSLSTGDVFVINPNVPHGFREINRLLLTNIMFDPLVFVPEKGLRKLPGFHTLFVLEPNQNAKGRFKNRLRLSPAQLTKITPLLQDLEREYRKKQQGYESAITGLFFLLTTYLSRAFKNISPTHPSSLLRLANALSHLEQNFTQPITLPDLATKSHLSINQFLRLFKEHYQTSPIDYLVRLRIQHACDLMRQTDRSITQIAFDVGFSDSNYFYRQFRKKVGTSALHFRKGL